MKGALTKKLGPLKTYQWGLIGLTLGLGIYWWHKSHPKEAGQPQETEGLPAFGPGSGSGGGGGNGGAEVEKKPEEHLNEFPEPHPEEPKPEKPEFLPGEFSDHEKPEAQKLKEAIEEGFKINDLVEHERNKNKPKLGKHTHSHPKKGKGEHPDHHKHSGKHNAKNPATARHKKKVHHKPRPLHTRLDKPQHHARPARKHVHPHAHTHAKPHRPAKPHRHNGKHHVRRRK